MLQQLIIKLQLPSTITASDDVQLQLLGYKFDPHHQISQLQQKNNVYDQSNVGTIVQLMAQQSKKTLKLYSNKDWNHIIRQVQPFAFQIQLLVFIKNVKMPSITVKSLQSKPKFSLQQLITLDFNSLPKEKQLTQIINKEAYNLVNKVSQKEHEPLHKQTSLIPQKMFNPHLFIKTPEKDKHIQYYTKGIYEYYHYSDQSFNDHGWGCAYRSLQTILSWLNLQNHCTLPSMLTLPQIQQTIDLINIGSDQTLKNTRQWIGATEVSWVVKKITNYDCRILHIADGKDIIEHCEMFREHFEKVGCPIMYGGGQYAYSIVGINYSCQLGECQFLILDPHYPGTDSLDKILEKKGLAWRKPDQMFKKGIFYNFCLPLIPSQE